MFGIATFTLLFGQWIIFSGKFDLFHLGLGALSSGIVALSSTSLLFQERRKTLIARGGEIYRFLGYAVWLLGQIVVANIHVIGLALSKNRMERDFDPHIFCFTSVLQTDFAKFVFANSITLTPGTVTIRVHGDRFYIHAISKKAAADLPETESLSEMERRVGRVFEADRMVFLADKGE